MKVTSAAIDEDKDYNPKLDKPAYGKNGPLVLLDAGHRNFPFQQPLLKLLSADGYKAIISENSFNFEDLRKASVLIIQNPGTMRNRKTIDNPEPLFTESEAATLYDWVAGGGALLITPGPQLDENVLRRFVVEFSASHLRDPELSSAEIVDGNTHYRVFSRDNDTLPRHKIISGRAEAEQVKTVFLQSIHAIIKSPENAAPLLRCSTQATLLPIDALQVREIQSPESLEKAKAGGEARSSQAPMPVPAPAARVPAAISFTVGKGRVVVLGSGDFLEALVIIRKIDGNVSRRRIGLTEADNQQLALNVMHWLSGLLE